MLTLCLGFNAAKHTNGTMEEFLGRWVKVLEDVCKEGEERSS
jgi:hypothetical protein